MTRDAYGFSCGSIPTHPATRHTALAFAFFVAATILLGVWHNAQAATSFIGSNNPGGIPDIDQQGPFSPGNSNGICAAAAMADILWNWSEFAPYDGSDGGQRLVDHPASANPAQNWPGTFGN
jgi:hypothetical protein